MVCFQLQHANEKTVDGDVNCIYWAGLLSTKMLILSFVGNILYFYWNTFGSSYTVMTILYMRGIFG